MAGPRPGCRLRRNKRAIARAGILVLEPRVELEQFAPGNN